MHQLSTTLCDFFRNLSKSVISHLSKSHVWRSIEINCISLSNEFTAKAFSSSVEKRVKHWKSSFNICYCRGGLHWNFYEFHLTSFFQTNFLFFGDIFWGGAHTGQPVWNSLWIRPCLQFNLTSGTTGHPLPQLVALDATVPWWITPCIKTKIPIDSFQEYCWSKNPAIRLDEKPNRPVQP